MVFDPAGVWSTTAMRSGTSIWPGPPAGPTMMRPCTPIFIDHLTVDDFAFARGAHEVALVFQRHGVVAAIGRRQRYGQRRRTLANVDQGAIDIGLLRVDDRPRIVRRSRSREEILDLVFERSGTRRCGGRQRRRRRGSRRRSGWWRRWRLRRRGGGRAAEYAAAAAGTSRQNARKRKQRHDRRAIEQHSRTGPQHSPFHR